MMITASLSYTALLQQSFTRVCKTYKMEYHGAVVEHKLSPGTLICRVGLRSCCCVHSLETNFTTLCVHSTRCINGYQQCILMEDKYVLFAMDYLMNT